MAGLTSGPAPKRDAERRRTNEPATGWARKGLLRPVEVPDPDPDWHPRATRWFESLHESGEADYFQNSDWAMALMVGDLISRAAHREWNVPAMMLGEINGMMTRLGTTEVDRRAAMRLELEETRPEEETVGNKALEVYSNVLSMPTRKAQ